MIKPYSYSDNPNTVFAEIDYDSSEIHLERRVFNIRTYAKLKARASEKHWQYIEPANNFIKTLDKEEYKRLVDLFVSAKRDLNHVTDQNTLMQAVAAIDSKIASTFGEMGLPERIFDYVVRDQKITLPSFQDIGKRPQDTPEKTFEEDEYHLLHTIITISKILFPIFGEIINKVSNTQGIDDSMKEIVAFGSINSLLANHFDIITQKLLLYIRRVVDTHLSDDPMLSFYGITETSITHDKLAKMVVKNFVNHDLYKDGGNIMRYISSSVKRAVGTDTSISNNKVRYKSMIPPDTSGDDTTNVSYLESAVNINVEPVDVPILVKYGINTFIDNYVEQNNIRLTVFDQAESYYRVTTLPLTMINELLAAMFISDPVGSAYSVKYMNMEMMVKLITVMQLYAINHGFKEIVPLLSMVPTGFAKVETDAVDNDIIIHDGRGTNPINYVLNLKEATAHIDDFVNFRFDGGKGDGDKRGKHFIDKLTEDIVMYLTKNVFNYNVAPTILELSDTGNTINDDGFLRYDSNIVSELFRFMYTLLHSDPDRRMV